MRVLFWGTPDFAVPPLRALIGEGFDVVAVVTQPDKPTGRSRSTVQAPPVKQIAMEEGVAVLQPDRPRGEEFMRELAALAPDISVVVAYGHILPKAVIDLPRLGTINIHASLLPKLRGAAPIQGAILEGLTETGVSIMQMVPALDAGPVIHRVKTPIVDDETGGELTLRLSEMGALAAVEALALIELGGQAPETQSEADATYAPKIDRGMTRVDWSRPAVEVSRVIRAYDPRPGAFTTHRGADLKVFGASVRAVPVNSGGEVADPAPGTVMHVDEDGMIVACGGMDLDDGVSNERAERRVHGSVRVAAIQPAGKRRSKPADLARGRGIAVGDRLT